jgi:hypothetical protein
VAVVGCRLYLKPLSYFRQKEADLSEEAVSQADQSYARYMKGVGIGLVVMGLVAMVFGLHSYFDAPR